MVLPTNEIVVAQQNDVRCQKIAQSNGTDARFTMDTKKVLIWKTHIDGDQNIIVSETNRRGKLYYSHYTILAGQLSVHQMYNEVKQKFYWPYIAMDMYKYVANC